MQISHDIMIGLTIAQLSLFTIFLIPTLIKLIISFMKSIPSMKTFFIFVCMYILSEMGMQIYQLVEELKPSSPNLYIVVGINVICIIFETFIMFLLSEYWKRASMSLENEIRNLKLKMKSDLKYQVIPIAIWTIIYIAFFIYFLLNTGDSLFQQILLYGCQAVTVILFLWGIIVQTIRGLRLLKALQRCEQMIGIELDKKNFIAIVWMTSVVDIARIIYLIFVTIFVLKEDQGWLWIYVFTITAILPLSFYILGFKVQEDNMMENGDMLKAIGSASQESRYTTELERRSEFVENSA